MKKINLALLPLLFFVGCGINDPKVPSEKENSEEIVLKEPDFNNGESFIDNKVLDEDLIQTNELEEELNADLSELEASDENPELEDIKIIKVSDTNTKEDILDVNQLYLNFYFDYNKYSLEEMKQTSKLKDLIKFLKEREDEFSNKKIVIEGNADQRGTDEYNYALGIKRAHYIKEQIIFNTSVLNDNIKIISYGETNTICSEDTEDCYKRNRRVEISVK
jgi:peptidoglycan-associated lipoprotein